MRLQLTLLLLIVVACAAPSKKKSTKVKVGDALSFSLPDPSGAIVASDQFDGNVRLVDLWATWCKPCKASLPFYAELQEKHGPEGFTVLAVSVDEDEDEMTGYLAEKKFPFVVLWDPKGTLPRKIGMADMPTMLILDRRGRVAFVHTGFDPSDRAVIAKAVSDAL